MKTIPLLSILFLITAAHAQIVPLQIPKNHGGFFRFAFSPDGTAVAGGTGTVSWTGSKTVDGGEVILWDAKTGKIRRTLGKHGATVDWPSWSGEGALLG